QVLLDPGRLSAFVGAFGAHTLSDNAGLDELGTLAGALRNLDPTKVTFVTVPTVDKANAAGDEVLRTDDAAALFAAIRSDRPLPGEAGAGAGPTAANADDSSPRVTAGDTVAPGLVTVAVRNGSSRVGLATQAADSLRSVGFTVGRVGDAEPTEGGETVVRHSPDRADQAATVAAAVPGAVSRAVPGPPGLLELVLGENFDGAVKAPAVDNPAVDSPGALPGELSTVNAADAACR
ncbi:MAG: LCP family protein, partial [Pseudonocardia sp.]